MPQRADSLGAKGTRVRRIQERLQELGFYVGELDGLFGPATEQSVEKFQTAKHLARDGSVGFETSQVLFATQFDNYAKHVGSRGKYDWFKWMVFVQEPGQKRAKIRTVEYRLHETFPNPIRVAQNPDDNFMIQSAGWGEFWIYITVYLAGGHEEVTKYYLDLGKGWPSEDG